MTSQLPQVVLLDLDDTILMLSATADPCWRQVCREFAPRAALGAGALFDAIQAQRRWFWQDPERHRCGRLDLRWARREIVASALGALGIDAPQLAAEIATAFIQAREAAIRPFPGAVETLHRLRGQGVRLGLITNGSGDSQRRKIDRFGLGPLFEVILIEGEFGVGKPDLRIYRHALDVLGVEAGETWMVGDNLEWDVWAPQQLGILGVWIDQAGRGLPDDSLTRPDRIIRALAELL